MHYNELLDITRGILQRRLLPGQQNVAAQLLRLRVAHRLYLVRTQVDLRKIWTEIRTQESPDDTSVVDFILMATADLLVAVGRDATFEDQTIASQSGDRLTGFPAIVDRFAEAYGQQTKKLDAAYNAIDADLLGRLPTVAVLHELYACNPWFVFLLLVDQLPIEAFRVVK